MFQYEPYDNTRSIGQIIELMMAGPHAAAQAARAGGEARAHAMEIAGQNSAQLGMTLGSIASGTAQQIAHQYSPEAKALQEQRQALADDRKQLTAERKGKEIREAMVREALPLLMSGELKPEAFISRVGPDGLDILKGMTAYKELADKQVVNARDTAGRLALGLKKLPADVQAQLWPHVRAAAIEGGLGDEQSIPPQPTPQFLDSILSWATGKESDLMTVPAGSSVYDKNAQPGAPPVFQAPAKPDVKHYEQKSVLLNGKEAVVSYDPSSGKSFDAQGADVSAHVKPMPPAATRVQVNAGPQEGALSPEGLDYAATQYRLTGVMPALGMGKNADRGKIINAAAQQAKAVGQTPAVAIQKQAARKADSASLTKMQTMRDGAASYESKALAQADIVADLSSKVDRTRFPIVNAAIMAGKTEIAGDENATKLLNAITTFSAEYSRILEGSTGSVAASSDSSRAAANRLISAKMSKGTLGGVLDLMKKEMGLTIQGYDATIDHITTRMGGSNLAPAPTDTSVAVKPPSAATVKLQAPDGTVKDVPAAEVDHYLKLGAKRVGG